MKNIFKKIAVIALVMIMCVSSIVPSISATGTNCPGENNTHTAANCSYTVVVKSEATCDAAGTVTGQCNSCGKKFVAESVDALGHDWDIAAATCTDPVTKTCKVCGKVETREGEVSCTWTEWTVTGGVCKIGERRSRTCTVCGAYESEGMREAHNWVVDSYVAPKLCNQPTVAYYVCENSGCDAKKTAELWLKAEDVDANGDGVVDFDVPVTSHAAFVTWDERQNQLLALDSEYRIKKDPNKVDPTCSTEGSMSMVCPDCDYVKVVPVAKEAHELEDLRKVPEVLQGGCGKQSAGRYAYWQCYDCDARFMAVVDTVTTYYAKDGTVYPVFTAEELQDMGLTENDYSWQKQGATYYPLYKVRTYKDDQFGALVTKDSQLKVTEGDGARWCQTHEAYATYVAATCTTDGYYTLRCSWCGADETKILPATGHVYYSSNPSATIQKAILKKNLGSSFNADNYTWSDYAPGEAAGYGITWATTTGDIIDPTCEENAYVYEICLNIHKTQGHYNESGNRVNASEAKCSATIVYEGENANTKKYTLSGKDYDALGHEWDEAEGADYDRSNAPTCTATGVVVITCANGCGKQKHETAPAKGHDFTGDPEVVVGFEPTCVKDGKGTVACSRECGVDPKEVVIPKSDKYHAYNYISAGNIYGHDAVADAMDDLKCGQSLDIVYSCDREGCPANLKTATMTYTNEAHKYYDVTDAENLKAIKELSGKGATITVDGVTAVEYAVVGDCTKVATYKLYCLNGTGCGMFDSFEISEGYNFGAHKAVYTGAVYPGNTCVELNGSDLAEYVIGRWYCKVKTCAYYSEDGVATGDYTVYSSHLNAKGEAITYKDVPHAAISGAATLADAQNVEAPKDANGNVTYYVDIPGTSLVWMFIAEGSCSNDEVKLGGFYCVDCGNADLENEAQRQLGDLRSEYHNVAVNGSAPDATCTAYGYSEMTCTKCFYTVQYGYQPIVDHNYVAVENGYKAPSCERDGYQVYKCDGEGCGLYKTVVIKATGHMIISGEEPNVTIVPLTGNCLDDLSVNRKCTVCEKKVALDHVYGADNKCTLCGYAKPQA